MSEEQQKEPVTQTQDHPPTTSTTDNTTESRERKNTLEKKPVEEKQEEKKEETPKKAAKQPEAETDRPDTVRDDATDTQADKTDGKQTTQQNENSIGTEKETNNQKTSEPEQQPKTKTSEPEKKAKSKTTEPEQKSKTKTSEPEQKPKTKTSEPEQKPKTKTSEPEHKPKTKTSEPEQKSKPKSNDTEQKSKQEVTKSQGKNSPRRGGSNREDYKQRDHQDSPRTQKSSSRPSTETSEGRKKQKEFFKLELSRLESGLKRESSKIHPPTKKPHMPYVFNTLEPYYNTYTTRYLVHLPEELKHGHTSRSTAQGLTDPWLDLRMDREILPAVPSKPVSRQMAILKKEKEIRERKKRSAMANSSSSKKFEGSTRLPKFPVVNLETQDLATKQLFYSDVPALRHELKTKYSSSAKTKVEEDYKRTQQDFYRMELDKLDEVHPINRSHMRSAYFAYLQNTPGSKKAITECVRGLKSGKA